VTDVYVNEVKMAEAEERSKKDAKKKAAKKALFILTN
jgi:dsRNA-specific ribonuclease